MFFNHIHKTIQHIFVETEALSRTYFSVVLCSSELNIIETGCELFTKTPSL